MSDPPPPPPPPPSSAPPPSAPEAGLGAVADAFENAVAPAAHKPRTLAALLTVAAPGMGHVFLEVEGPRKTRAFVLLAATVAAVVLSCFVWFPLAVAVYLGAVALAFRDLRGDLPDAPFSDLGRELSWRLVIGAGVLLAVALLLPWYRESVGGVTIAVSGRSALSVIDRVLAVIAIGSAVLGAAGLSQRVPQRVRGPLGIVVAVAGAIALALVVFRLIFTPPTDLELGIERSFGLLLAFAAAVLLAGGGAGAARLRAQ